MISKLQANTNNRRPNYQLDTSSKLHRTFRRNKAASLHSYISLNNIVYLPCNEQFTALSVQYGLLKTVMF